MIPRLLEQAEELFALRAARKHNVAVTDLPGLLDTLATASVCRKSRID